MKLQKNDIAEIKEKENYLLALRSAMLSCKDIGVDEKISAEYNRIIESLQKLSNRNLQSFKLTESDLDVSKEDIENPKLKIGFDYSGTDSTSKVGMQYITEQKYNLIKVITKINQILLFIEQLITKS